MSPGSWGHTLLCRWNAMPHLRIVLGVVGGYATMVVLITLVQEAWLGGVGYYESSLGVLLVAGAGTFASAVAGAVLGTAVAAGSRIVAIVMCALVVVETTALTITGRVAGPLWFDVLAAASLLAGIGLGSEIVRRRRGA